MIDYITYLACKSYNFSKCWSTCGKKQVWKKWYFELPKKKTRGGGVGGTLRWGLPSYHMYDNTDLTVLQKLYGVNLKPLNHRLPIFKAKQ